MFVSRYKHGVVVCDSFGCLLTIRPCLVSDCVYTCIIVHLFPCPPTFLPRRLVMEMSGVISELDEKLQQERRESQLLRQVIAPILIRYSILNNTRTSAYMPTRCRTPRAYIPSARTHTSRPSSLWTNTCLELLSALPLRIPRFHRLVFLFPIPPLPSFICFYGKLVCSHGKLA